MRTEFLCISVLRVASGPRVKLASCKSALNTPCSKTFANAMYTRQSRDLPVQNQYETDDLSLLFIMYKYT